MERREEKASEQAGVMGVESGASPMAWGKFAPDTGLMFSGQFMKRVLAGSFLACGWRVLLAELRRLPNPAGRN